MLVTDYQGRLISVFSSLIDRGTSSDMSAPPAPQCSGPVRAALRWAAPPVAAQINVYAGLLNNSAVEAMPAALTQRLDDEQRLVLWGSASPPRRCTWWTLWREPASRIWRDALSAVGGRCATAVRVSW